MHTGEEITQPRETVSEYSERKVKRKKKPTHRIDGFEICMNTMLYTMLEFFISIFLCMLNPSFRWVVFIAFSLMIIDFIGTLIYGVIDLNRGLSNLFMLLLDPQTDEEELAQPEAVDIMETVVPTDAEVRAYCGQYAEGERRGW